MTRVLADISSSPSCSSISNSSSSSSSRATSRSCLLPLLSLVSSLLLSPSSSIILPGVSATKKGVAFSSGSSHCDDLTRLDSVGWYYDWSCSDPCPGVDLPFFPMVWGSSALPCLSSLPSSSSGSLSPLLGFNEPNFSPQSHLSPQQAASLWPQLASSGRPLVSPAPATCWPSGAPSDNCVQDPWQWLDGFFAACGPGCRVDYIGLHSYTCDVQTVLDWVDLAWAKYGRPVWLTEIACEQDALANRQFAQQMVPLLDAHPRVGRYAWFASRTDSPGGASLFGPASGALTAVGSYYSRFRSSSSPIINGGACIPAVTAITRGATFPSSVPWDKDTSFSIAVAYGVMNTSVIVADLIGSATPYWYGSGKATVVRGTQNYVLRVTITNPIPASLSSVTLSLWTVDSVTYKADSLAWQRPAAKTDYEVQVNREGNGVLPADATEADLGAAVAIRCTVEAVDGGKNRNNNATDDLIGDSKNNNDKQRTGASSREVNVVSARFLMMVTIVSIGMGMLM